MSLAWLAQVVFFVTYFVAWVTKELPHTLADGSAAIWIAISAIAALVIAVLLVFENRGSLNRPGPVA